MNSTSFYKVNLKVGGNLNAIHKFVMCTSIKSIFVSKKSNTNSELPHDFDQVVKKAISLVKQSDVLNTDQEFLKCLMNNGIERNLAVDILLFLPIAFVRELFPTVKWLDTYIEYINEKKKQLKTNTARQKHIK